MSLLGNVAHDNMTANQQTKLALFPPNILLPWLQTQEFQQTKLALFSPKHSWNFAGIWRNSTTDKNWAIVNILFHWQPYRSWMVTGFLSGWGRVRGAHDEAGHLLCACDLALALCGMSLHSYLVSLVTIPLRRARFLGMRSLKGRKLQVGQVYW